MKNFSYSDLWDNEENGQIALNLLNFFSEKINPETLKEDLNFFAFESENTNETLKDANRKRFNIVRFLETTKEE